MLDVKKDAFDNCFINHEKNKNPKTFRQLLTFSPLFPSKGVSSRSRFYISVSAFSVLLENTVFSSAGCGIIRQKVDISMRFIYQKCGQARQATDRSETFRTRKMPRKIWPWRSDISLFSQQQQWHMSLFHFHSSQICSYPHPVSSRVSNHPPMCSFLIKIPCSECYAHPTHSPTAIYHYSAPAILL